MRSPSSRSTQRTAQSTRTTLKDVARECGVSSATVSFVVNNSRAVRADTRLRVLEAAQRMGYTANPLALGLSTGRSHTLGLLLPDLSPTLSLPIITGIEKAATKNGYKILPVLHHDDIEAALRTLPDLSARRLDGFLSTAWSAGEHPEIVSALPAVGLPYVVAFYRAAPEAGVDNVLVDHKHGGLLAGRHLQERGGKNIAFLGGPENREVTHDRLRGLQAALQERGVPLRGDLIFFGEFTFAGGEENTRKLLAAEITADRPRFDGIFAADDHIAAGALRVLRAQGLCVPDDVPLVSFNNNVIAQSTDPPLTSVNMPLYEVGHQAVERLLLRLDHPELWEPTTISLPCRLVVRQSA